jgi:hypothetical protein
MKFLLINVLFMLPLFANAMINNLTPMSNQTFQNIIVNGEKSLLEKFVKRVNQAPQEHQENMLNDIDFEAAKTHLKKALPYEPKLLSPGLQVVFNGAAALGCIGAMIVIQGDSSIAGAAGPVFLFNAGWSFLNMLLCKPVTDMLCDVEDLEKKRPSPVELLVEQ